MALRFRKSIPLLGRLLRLNITKTGASLTAGVPGAHVNLSKRGVTGTVSAPGTGLSYRQRLARFGPRRHRAIDLGDE